MSASLQAEEITARVNGKTLLADVSLNLQAGEVHAVLGANGAGKSTLLRAMAGELRPDAGQVLINGLAICQLAALQRARLRAVLPQTDGLRFAYTVDEVVRLGRYPWPSTGEQGERQTLDECLAAADVLHLRRRLYPTLSGGERRRVQLARVLAQLRGDTKVPRYLLLDEPTASLDIEHQHRCLHLAQSLASQGIGVLVVLHDLNLAARYASRYTLLHDGQVIAQGDAESALTATALMDTFGKKLRFSAHNEDGVLQFRIQFRG